MKALLFEHKNKIKHRPIMVLLPSGKLESGTGDPANIALELDGKTIRVWVILADEIATLEPVKEIEIEGHFLMDALEYRNARAEYLQKEVEFKDRLLNLMLIPHCDALTFLDMGSVIF